MKRYDCEWTPLGAVMEEHKEGAFVPFSEISGLADSVMKMGGRCQLLADLLREVTQIVPAIGVAIDDLPVVDAFLGRIEEALAGKLPEQVCANGFHLLREANHLRQEEWDIGSEKVSLSFLGNELAGETGELCNVLKKLERERIGIVGSRSTIEKAATELADVVICADLVARALGINTWDAVCNKFNYTSAKYGLKTMLFGTPNLIQQAVRTITEGQEFELTTVLQSIANGFSDDPAHDAAALLKRITSEVPWTGDSFQIPPRQGGEPCALEPRSSSPA